MIDIKIGDVLGTAGYQFQVLGYMNAGTGIQAIGNRIDGEYNGEAMIGCENREWIRGFNREPSEVWDVINDLPISEDAKMELAITGQYPAHTMDVVGMTHDKWRESLGKSPNWAFAMMIRGPKPLPAEFMKTLSDRT